jgi:hypothetical protein
MRSPVGRRGRRAADASARVPGPFPDEITEQSTTSQSLSSQRFSAVQVGTWPFPSPVTGHSRVLAPRDGGPTAPSRCTTTPIKTVPLATFVPVKARQTRALAEQPGDRPSAFAVIKGVARRRHRGGRGTDARHGETPSIRPKQVSRVFGLLCDLVGYRIATGGGVRRSPTWVGSSGETSRSRCSTIPSNAGPTASSKAP